MTTVCFCTLAIHDAYRQRARLLCQDVAPAPVVVLTDEPDDFADLPVRVLTHSPTGPMAVDYHRLGIRTGTGAAAYHDKRFALKAALAEYRTAIFVDADSRVHGATTVEGLAPGLAVRPATPESVAEHLGSYGPERLPAFEDLARTLFGTTSALEDGRWIYESCFAVTRDGRARRFFDAWGYAADFMQGRGLYSGEGGVIGLAAAFAGWPVDYQGLAQVSQVVRHEACLGAAITASPRAPR